MKENYLTRAFFYGIVGLILTVLSLCAYFIQIPFIPESFKLPCTGCLVALTICNYVKCGVLLAFHNANNHYPF